MGIDVPSPSASARLVEEKFLDVSDQPTQAKFAVEFQQEDVESALQDAKQEKVTLRISWSQLAQLQAALKAADQSIGGTHMESIQNENSRRQLEQVATSRPQALTLQPPAPYR